MRVFRIGVSTAVLLSLISCSMFSSDRNRIDYGAAASRVPTLEVPPDLTTPLSDPRYKLPQAEAAGVATYSAYNKTDAAKSGGEVVDVLPDIPGVRLVRSGTQRWLAISDKAENVWPVVKQFWQDVGMKIKSENRAAGIMETGWEQDTAKLPKYDYRNDDDSPINDTTYLVGERDQYTTRLERSNDGSGTELYITQRGMDEIYSGDRTAPKWQPRGNDPEKEAIMLQRLMVRFGSSKDRAADAFAQSKAAPAASSVAAAGTMAATPATATAVAGAAGLAGAASLREISEGNTVIVMNDSFDRSWRKVGLAIENAGLGVEDKDREKGVYYLRPIKVDTGWLDKLKFWKSDVDTSRHYRVIVKDGGATCEVSVTDQHGASNKASKEMLDGIYKTVSRQ
jgi:outer membrane protein assembly factor BamC